jgi:hypothetical protein
MAWLEAETATAGSGAEWPPESAVLDGEEIDRLHPGERQLERMERQVDVLYRQLRGLRQHGWLPGPKSA